MWALKISIKSLYSTSIYKTLWSFEVFVWTSVTSNPVPFPKNTSYTTIATTRAGWLPHTRETFTWSVDSPKTHMLLGEGENHILLAIRPDFSYRMHRTYLTPSPEIHVDLTELFFPEVHSLSGFCPIPGIFDLLDIWREEMVNGNSPLNLPC